MTVPPPPGSTPPPPPPMPPTPPTPPGPGMTPPPPPIGGPSSRTNGTATAALVCGILSPICFGIFTGIPAIFLGIAGKKKAEQLGGEGRGQATAGLVLGIIGTILSIIGIIIFIISIAAADTTIDKVDKRIDRANEQISRNGTEAKSGDYEISEEEVKVSQFGYTTYTAFIENTADFETGFTIEVKCEGDQGDIDTQKGYAYSVSPGDKKEFSTYSSFSDDTTDVTCEVEEVLYGY